MTSKPTPPTHMKKRRRKIVDEEDGGDGAKRAREEEASVVDVAPPLLPTIQFEDGSARSPTRTGAVPWESEASGIAAAQLVEGGCEPVRLLGTFVAEFEVKDKKVWKWLTREVPKSRREKTKLHELGVEVFSRRGEPGCPASARHVPVFRLVQAILNGRLTTDSKTLRVLECIDALQTPANVAKFGAPGLRTLGLLRSGDRVELRVYATRLLFYLIADESVKTVVDSLDPATPVAFRACEPSSYRADPLFVNPSPHASPFSLESVMRSSEHPGGPEIERVPETLKLEMYPYQKQALSWMLGMERLRGGVNSLFWEKRSFVDGGDWYYSPDIGECRLEPPELSKGGLLCDEMGLGKTLQVVGLMLANPGGQSLVVVPNPLVAQWQDEISKSTDALRVLTFVGDSSSESWPGDENSFDVCLTTYETVRDRKKSKPLFKRRWHRVVLDEMQMVSSPNTIVSRRCCGLDAELRWMVSGTPLSDSVDDLNGELRFLRVCPFSLSDKTDGYWEHSIKGPWARQDTDALDRLGMLLRKISLRRSKAQVYARGHMTGRKIIDLPDRFDRRVALEPPPTSSEALAIRACEALAAAALRGVAFHASAERIRETAFRVARAASTSLHVVSDRDVDDLSRFSSQSSSGHPRHDLAGLSSSLTSYVPPALSPADAIATLAVRDNSFVTRRQRAGAIGAENFLGHGREDVGRVHAAARATSTLTLVERSNRVRARIAQLETRRRDAKNAVRDAALKWTLARCVCCSGLLETFSGETQELSLRRRCKFARVLLKDIPERKRAWHRRWDQRGLLAFVESKIETMGLFSWADVVAAQAEAVRVEGHLQLELRALKQQAERIDESARLAREERDSKEKEAMELFAQLAEMRSLRLPDGPSPELLEFEAADAAHNEILIRNSQFRQRETEVAQERRKSAELALFSGDSNRAEEREIATLSSRARELQRDSRLAAERLGADATDEQKRVWQELQSRKLSSKNLSAREKAELKASERFFLSQLPVEAARFFVPVENEPAEAQLQLQVTQSGFFDLGRLEDPRNHPLMRCPVCFCVVDYEKKIANSSTAALLYTGCLHSMCLGCAQQIVLTKGVEDATRKRGVRRDTALRLADSGELDAPCVICRKNFRLTECVIVSRFSEDDEQKEKEFGDEDDLSVADDDRKEGAPRFSLAPSLAEAVYAGLAAPPENHPTQYYLTRRATITPCIGLKLLGHISAARSVELSFKVSACVNDVRKIVDADRTEKVVVFTSVRSATTMLLKAFQSAKIGCSLLNEKKNSTEAVATWRFDPTCSVFVVYSGVTTAGLTLTAARHLFVLEPFMSIGEELQAKNRCHRIGQTRQVYTTTYYVKNTIDERVLAYRDQDNTNKAEESLSSLSHPRPSDDSEFDDMLNYVLGVFPRSS